eukprot:915515_1
MLKFRCTLTSKPDEVDHDGEMKDSQVFWFHQDEGKKSSFTLNSSDVSSPLKIDKPCHLLIDCSQTGTPWIFGGLEIQTNSRNVEVYAIPEGKDGAEYWQTHRGSREDDESLLGGNDADPCENELYNAVILSPSSKPESIVRLHVKLLSLRPARCTVGFVRSMKLKGRLPDIQTIKSHVENDTSASPTVSASSQNTATIPVHVHVPPKPTFLAPPQAAPLRESTSDISSAVAALTMMIKNIHGSMETALETTSGGIQKMAYSQNSKIVGLEGNVGKLQEGVKSLTVEVMALREENLRLREELQLERISLQLERKEMTSDADKIQKLIADKFVCDKDVISKLLDEQRQLIIKEIRGGKVEVSALPVSEQDTDDESDE